MIRKSILHRGSVVPVFFIFICLISRCAHEKSDSDVMDGEYWRSQGLTQVIPFWQKHVVDSINGGFFLNLSREGNPLPPFDKHPAMIGRQIYGFTCAYLLSGDEEYLKSARHGAEYLLDYAWDKEYGGWYDLLDEKGNPKSTSKTVPNELYTNVGLAHYYFVTGDKRVLEKIIESIKIRKTFAHDSINGGYFQTLNRDLSVNDSTKSKHSHYGYTSSLLINLMLFTRDKEVSDFAEELMNLSIDHMTDPSYGWFNGFPSPNDIIWNPVKRSINGKEVISAGAQLTATLSLLRMYEATGNKIYGERGMALGKQLMNSAYDSESGIWLDNIEKEPPFAPADTSNVWWWLQSYGIFTQLHLYHLTGEVQYLKTFSKMASFWSDNFIDKEFGGAYQSVTPSGTVLNTAKASPWKASYHEMETALLNYLYLNLYVNKKSSTLHFNITAAVKGDKHYVSLAEVPEVVIGSVTINGKDWKSFNPAERSVTLPEGKNLKMIVTLKPTK
jgi:mannose/cellobiose epimerase-like protein (N-acyl-D-glucosamine 2-epimerase family)